MRRLANPVVTGPLLKLLGNAGASFAPLLRNTVNPTVVRGGQKVNVMPSEIVLDLDCRLLLGYSPTDLMAELGQIIGDDVELELFRYDPGPEEADLGMFDLLCDILRQADPEGVPVPMLLPGSTDGRFFSRLGIQTYGFLPMSLPPGFDLPKVIHGPDERIPVHALSFGTQAIYRLLQRFGETPGL